MWRKGNLPTLLLECKLVQWLWIPVWRFLIKLKIELPHDPAIPLLGTHSAKIKTEKRNMHPNVHCNTIYNSRTWKQPICPARE